MKHDIIRSYTNDVTEKIDGDWERIGWVKGYPIFYVKKGNGKNHILVSGGIHGDEPAGTLAAMEFKPTDKELNNFVFHIYPCVNPWGYERHLRENADNLDINRGFKNKIEIEECKILSDHIKTINNQFLFTADFHESSPNGEHDGYDPKLNPKGSFLFETCENKQIRMGNKMVDVLREFGIPVCEQETIYNDINNKGVIWYPESMRCEDYLTGDSFDAWLYKYYTKQSFTFETDTTMDLESRKIGQHLMLHKALEIRMEELNENYSS